MEKSDTMVESSDIDTIGLHLKSCEILDRIIAKCKDLQQEIITAKNLLSKQGRVMETHPSGYLFDEDLEELNYLRQHFTTFIEWYRQTKPKDQVVTPSPAAAKMKK